MALALQLCVVRERFAEKRGWIATAEKEATLRSIICAVFSIPIPERRIASSMVSGMK